MAAEGGGRGRRALWGRGAAPFEEWLLQMTYKQASSGDEVLHCCPHVRQATRLPFPEEGGPAARGRAWGPRPDSVGHTGTQFRVRGLPAHPEEQAGCRAEKLHPRPSRCSGEAACNPAHRQAAGLGSAARARGLLVHRRGQLGGGPPAARAPGPVGRARPALRVRCVCRVRTVHSDAGCCAGPDRDLGGGRAATLAGVAGCCSPLAAVSLPPLSLPEARVQTEAGVAAARLHLHTVGRRGPRPTPATGGAENTAGFERASCENEGALARAHILR